MSVGAEAGDSAGPMKPTNEEVDLHHLMELLDIALSSDNPAIKDLLQKLLMTAVLVSSERPIQRASGPFSRMSSDISYLKDRIRNLENIISSIRGSTIETLSKQTYPSPYKSGSIVPKKYEMEEATKNIETIKKLLGK
jgi:hypothetical protein